MNPLQALFKTAEVARQGYSSSSTGSGQPVDSGFSWLTLGIIIGVPVAFGFLYCLGRLGCRRVDACREASREAEVQGMPEDRTPLQAQRVALLGQRSFWQRCCCAKTTGRGFCADVGEGVGEAGEVIARCLSGGA